MCNSANFTSRDISTFSKVPAKELYIFPSGKLNVRLVWLYRSLLTQMNLDRLVKPLLALKERSQVHSPLHSLK